MKLSEIGVRRPVLTTMVFLGLVVVGLVSLSRLGLDFMPNLEVPVVTVVTRYPGAGPQEVESQVTRPLEKEMATIGGLDKIESTSSQDFSLVILKFEWGVNLEEKANEVRDKIGLVETLLPDEVDRPFVMKFNLAMMPVLVIGVEAKESYPRMYEYLDKRVSRQLEQLEGVASAEIMGGEIRQIRVNLDLKRLEAYQVSIDRVTGAIRDANLNLPGGEVRAGPYEFIIRTPGEVTVKELNRLVVGYRAGRPVYLSDLGLVQDAFAEKTGDASVNRKPGLFMMVYKQSGTNTVLVANRLKRELAVISRTLPPDVKLHSVFDQADFIRRSINSLRDSLFQGGILVVLVIFFFIRNLRSSLIVVASIPISLISTFILLYGAGFTLNLVSLSSLGIAVGMVVDASIVVFENILRHREEGESRFSAALSGVNEVAPAVIASILAVVTVFVPVIFTGGIGGMMFRQLALAFSFTLFCSLFTALTLVPFLSSRFLQLPGESSGRQQRLFQRGEVFFQQLSVRYRQTLDWILNHKKKTSIAGVAVLAASLLLMPLVGTEFMPEMDQGLLMYTVELPVGNRQEETSRFLQKVENTITEKVPEAEVVMGWWGRASQATQVGGPGGGKPDASYRGTLMIKLKPKSQRKLSTRDIARKLQPFFHYPEGRVLFGSSDPISSFIFGGAKPLTVEIRGNDLEASRFLSRQVAQVLTAVPGVADVTISRDEGLPEYQVRVKRDKASLMGLSVSGIANQVKTYFAGDTSNQFRESGEQYDVMVRLRPEDREDYLTLSGAYISTPAGGIVRLSDVAEVIRGSGPVYIQRRNQERIVEVSGEIYGRSLSSVVSDVQPKLKKLVLPPSFTASFAGGRAEQAKSFRTMGFALVLSILLVYMVMASQFESYLDPLVIMFAVPFSIIGVVWSLFLTGNTFSLTAFLGLIMLVGIVEETGIILLSFVIDLRRKGLPLRDAVLQAGQLRLRPVLMTSLTTILGMVPLALARGEGSEFFRPLAIVIIGGLFVALVATLFLIPLFYYLFEERIKPRFSNSLNKTE